MVSAVAGRAAYTEVKAIREGRVNLKDSCGKVEAGEVFLHNLHVSPYSHRGYAEHEPLRRRKLLLNKREIGLVKVTVGVAKGKKTYDKRETIERRRIDRETRAMVKNAPENGPGADGRRPGSSLDRIADALLAGREVRAFVDRGRVAELRRGRLRGHGRAAAGRAGARAVPLRRVRARHVVRGGDGAGESPGHRARHPRHHPGRSRAVAPRDRHVVRRRPAAGRCRGWPRSRPRRCS